MKLQSLFSLSVLGIIVPLTAIAPAGGYATPTAPVTLADEKLPAPDAATAPTKMSDIIIIDADKGKTIELKVGRRLLVRLPANPTTGYEWSAVKLDEKVLAPDGETEFDVPETPMAGAPTVQTLFFKAKSAGKIKLELRYERPWEKETAPLKIYRVNIVVSENIRD